jgi:hypothetical protein
MGELPHYLEQQAANGGTLQEELLLELVKAIKEQNAILDDTIHAELVALNANLGALTSIIRGGGYRPG